MSGHGNRTPNRGMLFSDIATTSRNLSVISRVEKFITSKVAHQAPFLPRCSEFQVISRLFIAFDEKVRLFKGFSMTSLFFSNQAENESTARQLRKETMGLNFGWKKLFVKQKDEVVALCFSIHSKRSHRPNFIHAVRRTTSAPLGQ